MSATNSISIRIIKVGDTKSVTFKGRIFDWHPKLAKNVNNVLEVVFFLNIFNTFFS